MVWVGKFCYEKKGNCKCGSELTRFDAYIISEVAILIFCAFGIKKHVR